ncbi:MAG: ABC-type multidrug transport system ATPase subunit/pSer/pThr [Myxococcota bacterium]|jgi:ABC-type multidrug transport system ATPase subunit/pSer/pThr/pTyr-binding forkhead associated (FHA) protein
MSQQPPARCAQCSAPQPPGARFCGQCGADADPSVPEGPITLGSAPDNRVVLEHDTVSGHHAVLEDLGGGQYRLRDLGSTNGTWVGGRKVSEATVSIRDMVQLGALPVRLGAALGSMVRASARPVTGGRALVVGSDPASSDLVVPYPMVSRRHLRLEVTERGVQVTDLDSSNGTWIGGQRISSALLDGAAALQLGSYRVPSGVLDEWLLQLQQPAERHPIPADGTIVIGRSPDVEVTIDSPVVSWRHARIRATGGAWVVEDLGSANGTFVNGARVRQAPVTAADTLSLGSHQLYLTPGAIRRPQPLDGGVKLDAVKLCRKLPDGRQILNEVSISFCPGEFIAILGPSGAGKTTLLELLTGQRRPSSGQVRFNGADLHSRVSGLRDQIGYVPQEDIMHRDLTVEEVLGHTAAMRLPRDLPAAAVQARIDTVLTEMGLAHIRGRTIGGERVRGISGGQRKRVNIAIELLTEPPMLFLDEPTSGLDATSALEVMRVLRQLADRGKTVVLTIHQPRREAFDLLDHVLLLAVGGYLAYFGPAGDGSVAYCREHGRRLWSTEINPADFLIDSLEPADQSQRVPPEDWQGIYLRSSSYREYVHQRIEGSPSGTPLQPTRRRGLVRQYANQLARYTRRKARDRVSLFILLAQAPIIGGLLAWLFSDVDGLSETLLLDPLASDGVTPTLFLLCAAAFWLGCSNVARELVADRPVFRRERMAGLSVLAYLSSIFTLQVMLVGLQTLVLGGLAWGLVSLSLLSLLPGLVVLFVTGVCGVSLGLLVSSLAPTEVTAISVVPLLLLPQLMLAGYLKAYGDLSVLQEVAANFIPLRWAFGGLAALEYHAADVESFFYADGLGFPDFGIPAVVDVSVLVMFSVTFAGVALVRLYTLSTSSG